MEKPQSTNTELWINSSQLPQSDDEKAVQQIVDLTGTRSKRLDVEILERTGCYEERRLCQAQPLSFRYS